MMIYKDTTTLDAPSLVKEEMDTEVYDEGSEPKRKRVGIGTKRPRKTCRARMDCFSVMDRAQEVQKTLDQEFPSFIKLMLRSHVTTGFYMRLPTKFWTKHMPKAEVPVVLVEENGEKHTVKFIVANNPGFSSGWKGFAVKHKLQEGDAVVFQLVSRCKFKVYIVRRNDLANADGALDLLKLEANPRENNSQADARSFEEAETSKKAEGNLRSKTLILPDNAQTNDQLEHCWKDSVAEGTNCFDNAGSFVNFQSFTVTVNGFALDSELSECVRTKYYELCFSRKSYLHECLLKSINPRLAAEVISETVSIADSIRAGDVFTSLDNFAVWDKTLEGFESLGMEVDFLRSRLSKLLRLALKSGERPDFKRYNEAKLELKRVEEDILTFETTLSLLNQTKSVLESEINTLKANVQRYGRIFEEETARAP